VHSREAAWHLSSPDFSGGESTSISLAGKYCKSLNTNHYKKKFTFYEHKNNNSLFFKFIIEVAANEWRWRYDLW
jgi:hypothetical protein